MTKLHRVNIWRIAEQCGIRLKDGFEHSPASRRPKECYCKPTLTRIGKKHGPDHLRLVLQLMTGTVANSDTLHADMVSAVSKVLAQNPGLVKEPDLVDRFDAIDLRALRERAKAMNCGVAKSDIITVLLMQAINEVREAA